MDGRYNLLFGVNLLFSPSTASLFFSPPLPFLMLPFNSHNKKWPSLARRSGERFELLDLDLSNKWQTSHREYHTNEKEEMLLAMSRLQVGVGLERLHHHAFN